MIRLPGQVYHYLRALLSRGPNYMILFVTGRCNLRCPHCFYLDEIETATRERELRLDEFEKISKSLPRLLQLTFTGGETFLRDDIDQIAAIFYHNSHTRFFTLTTNGTMPERIASKVEAIARVCPLATIRVPLSLDGTEAVHDIARRRPGAWQELLKTYVSLRALADRVDNVRLDITTVLSKLNQSEIDELIGYVHDHLQIENHTILFPRGNIRDKESIIPEERKYREIVSKTSVRRRRRYEFPFLSRVLLNLRETVEKVIIGFQATGQLPFACEAGTRLIEMNEYGKLFPCETLESLKPVGFEDTWMGDVREFDYDVPLALNSDKAQRIRRFIQNRGCACTFECAISATLVLKPTNYLRVWLKNFRTGSLPPPS